MTALLLFGIFALLLIVGVPISLSLTIAAVIPMFLLLDIPLVVVAQKFFTSVDSYGLMAIPFFMIAGGLLEKGGVSKRLVSFANSLVGSLPGGLAVVTFVASAFFGAISGSAVATVAAIGSIMVPAMLKEGYPLKFALSTVASAGYLGIIIPPSIPMVIYGLAADVSVGEVFMGGFIPGIMLAGGMSVYSLIYGKKHLKTDKRFSLREVGTTFKEAIWALLMPLIILGGIYGGIFTPTESAAVASLYGIIIGFFLYKELTFDKVKVIIRGAVVSSAMIMFVIAAATVFGLVMTRELIPAKVAGFILSISSSPSVFLLLVIALFLVVGTFMDVVPAVMILTPILSPILTKMNIDPVAFGVIMIITLGIGLVTPPVGINLYVAAGLKKTAIENVLSIHLLWYIVASIVILLIVTYIPSIILFLPGLMK